MTIGAVLAGLSLVVVSAAFVLRPLIRRGEVDDAPAAPLPPTVLGEALASLRELDFDRRLGTVQEHDYLAARARLMAQAAEAMAASPEASLEPALEARVAEIRSRLERGDHIEACRACGHRRHPADRYCPRCGSPQAGVCPSCGRSIAEEDRFCAGCGLRLGSRAAAIG